jgi:AraC family transcriptional regulator
MHEAQQRLVDPRMPISDGALAVGYHTPSASTAAFRRLTGVTPREYRRML